MECLLSHLVKIGVFRNHLIADININIPSYCHATSKFFSLFFNEIFECDLEPKEVFSLIPHKGVLIILVIVTFVNQEGVIGQGT